MNKIIALLLSLVMVFSLSACGDKTTNSSNEENIKKSDIVDISKMSEEELMEIAETNAIAYLKQKYPDLDYSASTSIDVSNGFSYVYDELKQVKYYYNDKTFEENGIHKKTYEVTIFGLSENAINVMTDVSKKGTAGINSCYDDYQYEDILKAIFCKANQKEVSDTDSIDDVFNGEKDRFNIGYFHTFYDNTKSIVEFLETAKEFKDKSKYNLVCIERIYADITNLSQEQKTFYSYFTEIYFYSMENNYRYPENSLTPNHKRVYNIGTVGFYNTLAPYLDGIDKVLKFDATVGEFVEIPHTIIEARDEASTINGGVYEYVANGGNTKKYDAVISGNLSDHIDKIKELEDEYSSWSDFSLISSFYVAKEGYNYYIGIKRIQTEPNRRTGLVIVNNGEYTFKGLAVTPMFDTSCLIDYDKAYINPLDLTDGCTFFVVSYKINSK